MALFVFDKIRASKHHQRNKYRVPEGVFHTLELLGGAFATLPLCFLLKHKIGKKNKTYFVYFSAVMVIGWISLLVLMQTQFGTIDIFAIAMNELD